MYTRETIKIRDKDINMCIGKRIATKLVKRVVSIALENENKRERG